VKGKKVSQTNCFLEPAKRKARIMESLLQRNFLKLLNKRGLGKKLKVLLETKLYFRPSIQVLH